MSRQPISHPYPPNYRHLSPQPGYSPDPGGGNGSESISYHYPSRYEDPHRSSTPYDTPPRQHQPLGRTRSTSDSSLAPIVPIGAGMGMGMGGYDQARLGTPGEKPVDMARRESTKKGTDAGGHDEYPEGWSKEDEEAEKAFLKAGMFDWRSMKSWRFWIRKEWWYWYLGAVILGVLVALMALYHDDIVEWLTPVAAWMKDLPAGWTIPIAVIFILSFPPLFGQEIVAILCGVVWGLWVGFGIVAAGTLLGEVGNFYAFKYWCRSRAEKYERGNLNYAIMAHVVRDGGFFFIFAVRLSAIPGHFSTAVFATCGMNIFIFTIACILTMPKQLIVVYLGVLFNEQHKSEKSRIISWVVLVIGFLITIWAVWYCYKEMNKVKLVVWRKQRMALAAKGISIDPVTGKRRQSYRENILPPGPEEEVLSPILPRDPEQGRPGSYQPGYNIGYQRAADNMSVYHVDAPQRLPERDIAFGHGLHPDNSVSSGNAVFPTAHPTTQGVQRNPSMFSTYPNNPEIPIQPTSFPIPAPVPAGGPSGGGGHPLSPGYQGGGYPPQDGGDGRGMYPASLMPGQSR